MDKTYQKMSQLFYWPNMFKQIAKYVKSCEICQRTKSNVKKNTRLLHPLPVPDEPWTSVAMDLIVKLPVTKRKNNAVLTVVNRMSKRVRLIPMQESFGTQKVAKLFFKNIVCQFGLPKSIVSDRD